MHVEVPFSLLVPAVLAMTAGAVYYVLWFLYMRFVHDENGVRFDNRTVGWCQFCGGVQPDWKAFPEHPGCAEFKEELQSLQAGELTKDFHHLASETVLARSIGEIDPAAEVELKAHEYGPMLLFYSAKVRRRRSLIKSAHKE